MPRDLKLEIAHEALASYLAAQASGEMFPSAEAVETFLRRMVHHDSRARARAYKQEVRFLTTSLYESGGAHDTSRALDPNRDLVPGAVVKDIPPDLVLELLDFLQAVRDNLKSSNPTYWKFWNTRNWDFHPRAEDSSKEGAKSWQRRVHALIKALREEASSRSKGGRYRDFYREVSKRLDPHRRQDGPKQGTSKKHATDTAKLAKAMEDLLRVSEDLGKGLEAEGADLDDPEDDDEDRSEGGDGDEDEDAEDDEEEEEDQGKKRKLPKK